MPGQATTTASTHSEKTKQKASKQSRTVGTIETPVPDVTDSVPPTTKIGEFQKQNALSVFFGLLPIAYKKECWEWCSESFLVCDDETASHRRPDFEFWITNDTRRVLGECKIGNLTATLFKDVMQKRYLQLAETQNGRKYELWFICDQYSPSMRVVLEGVSALHGMPIRVLTYTELVYEVLADLNKWVVSSKKITPHHYRSIQMRVDERCSILFTS